MPLTAEARRRGGLKRAQQFTRESQQYARSKVRAESNQANGRKGGQAILERRGHEYLGQLSARYRRKHPSKPEGILMSWLIEWKEPFAREVQVAPGVFADFLLPLDVIIEVDDERWHTNDPLHGDDREGRDAERERLMRARGYTHIIHLKAENILNRSAKEALRKQLEELSSIPF